MPTVKPTNKLDLKVCEACGALWLRPASAGVYCARCAAMFAAFPAPRRPRHRRNAAAATPIVCRSLRPRA